MKKDILQRILPFEGLCLTSQDFLDEQTYHRQNLCRHNLHLHGHGIVQGLTVELQQRKGGYIAIIQNGFGITKTGQGVHLADAKAVELDVPTKDGAYMLWLFHVESQDDKDMRPVFDSNDLRSARMNESCAPRLHADGEEHEDAVALCRINVRMGRMAQAQWPVPRAGRQVRAAESYLKPRVIEFIELNKKIISLLLRTKQIKEVEVPTLSFNAALISSEFLLIEEGTSDRVLYRTSGSLISYAHDFYNSQPSVLESIDRFREFVRQTNAQLPNATQSNEVWLRWFRKFEQLLRPLKQISEELVKTIGPQR